MGYTPPVKHQEWKGLSTLKNYLVLLILALVFTSACATTTVPEPTLLQTGMTQHLPEEVTLLPALDSRTFPGDRVKPDPISGINIVVPADQIMAEGEKAWQQAGLSPQIRAYQGPLPRPLPLSGPNSLCAD